MENESAEFYSVLADRYPEKADIFQTLVNENGKYITQIERAYFGVIIDALEGCFALNLDSSLYVINTKLPNEINLKAAVEQAPEIEKDHSIFY